MCKPYQLRSILCIYGGEHCFNKRIFFSERKENAEKFFRKFFTCGNWFYHLSFYLDEFTCENIYDRRSMDAYRNYLSRNKNKRISKANTGDYFFIGGCRNFLR